MIMIKAIVRPERYACILEKLAAAGYPAATKIDVLGRGKQSGLKLGAVVYDELPKVMLMMVVPRKDRLFVIDIIMTEGRVGDKGSFGDGKIFVSPVEEVYTISAHSGDSLKA